MLMVLVFSSTAVSAEAAEADPSGEVVFEDSLELLDEEAWGVLESWGITKDDVFTDNPKDGGRILAVVGELLASSLKNPLSAFGNAFAVLLLGWVANALLPPDTISAGSVMRYAVCLCLAGVLLHPMSYTLEKAVSAVTTVSRFLIAFLPAYAGILLASGQRMTAAGTGNLIFGCAQIVEWIAGYLLMPLLGMYTALAFSQTLSGDTNLSGIVITIKRGLCWLLGLSAAAFAAAVAMVGLSNGASDSIARRAGQYFIGNLVPVIGGALSESMSALQGYAGFLKTSGGVLCIAVLMAIVLPVLVETLLWRVVLMLLTGIGQLGSHSSLHLLLRSLEEGMGLLSAVLVSCLVMFVFSLGVLLLAGGGG